MNQGICSAIRNRKVLRLTYDWGHRLVEPHCYGVNTKGHDLLRAYQVSGDSKSNEPQGWKLFRVDEIQRLAALDTTFAIRADYKRGDKAMSQMIFCEI